MQNGTPSAIEGRKVFLDLTHLGRHVTGIERVTIEQFEKVEFAGADVRHVRARGILSMIFRQQVLLPLLAMLNPRALFVFPGFPPSPLFALVARERTLLYVHDCFLITRRADLGLKAKLYMAWPFAFAVRRLRHFLTNSEKTRAELARFAPAGASIALYRPAVRNVFGLSAQGRDVRPHSPAPLRIVTVGTVEPRKNYAAAAAIREALEQRGFRDVRLDIVGRPGWGDAARALEKTRGVHVLGYLETEAARRVLEAADLYLCTSHDEGLGLPLLEAQFAGLPVIAPDAPVFREVLGGSGLLVDPAQPDAAAARIAALLGTPDWRPRQTALALANVARWNALAAADLASARHIATVGVAGRAAAAVPAG